MTCGHTHIALPTHTSLTILFISFLFLLTPGTDIFHIYDIYIHNSYHRTCTSVRHVCTLYGTCVLSTSRVYSVRHVCTLYVTCVACMSRVYSVRHVCTLYVTCVLCTSRVYSVRHLCTLNVTCVPCMSRVYSVRHVCTLYVTCVLCAAFCTQYLRRLCTLAH